MFDALAELTKSLLIPGTLTFLLFVLTIGLGFAYGPQRTRRLALPLLTALALSYWVASIPAIADVVATRFHAADSGLATSETLTGIRAIVVLGAGIRSSYPAGGHTMVVPDPQTVYNAVEGARISRLFEHQLPVVASGGRQDGAEPEATESGVLRMWLVRAGVPEERIVLESGSRNTREQARLVAPLLKERHWERFALVTPAVQSPRAATVFRLQGVDPVVAAAPFWPEPVRGSKQGWTPNGTALRASERATYDYLAWGYYWFRGWLR